MKNILVPTDFSKNSWNSLIYSMSFFKNVNCKFHILHVLPPTNTINGELQKDIDQLDNISMSKKQTVQLCQNTVLPSFPNHNFFYYEEHNLLIDAIRKHVFEKKIDLIVMGTKGTSGAEDVSVGRNTMDVITKVKCPVLVIPEKAKYKKIRNAAFPTDYNSAYNNRVISTICETIDLHNARLRILHLRKTERELTSFQKENKSLLKTSIEKRKISFHDLNDKTPTAIGSFIASDNIDLITMYAKNLNFFQCLFFTPTVASASYHSEIPMLVLHE